MGQTAPDASQGITTPDGVFVPLVCTGFVFTCCYLILFLRRALVWPVAWHAQRCSTTSSLSTTLHRSTSSLAAAASGVFSALTNNLGFFRYLLKVRFDYN
jgi:hypothetical protein